MPNPATTYIFVGLLMAVFSTIMLVFGRAAVKRDSAAGQDQGGSAILIWVGAAMLALGGAVLVLGSKYTSGIV